MNLGDESQSYDPEKRKIDCETCYFTEVKKRRCSETEGLRFI